MCFIKSTSSSVAVLHPFSKCVRLFLKPTLHYLEKNEGHIKLSHTHEHKPNIMQPQKYFFITHYSVCLISYIYAPCCCKSLITLLVTYQMKFTCIYMIIWVSTLNLFQFLCDISMKPDYRCNICYAVDTYLKSPNDTNVHYYFHSEYLKRTNLFTTIDYSNFQDTHSITIPTILIHSQELPFQT